MNRTLVSATVAVVCAVAIAGAWLLLGRQDPPAPAGTESIGMACVAGSVDGTPVGFEQQQEFLRRHVPLPVYRAPGMYVVVYPSTGGADHGFIKPDPSWVLDTSATAKRTCAVYLVAATPRSS